MDRYTIKFGPAVSRQQLEKALNDPTIHGDAEVSKRMHKLKVRVECLCDIEARAHQSGLGTAEDSLD
jgi:hypothetical protein